MILVDTSGLLANYDEGERRHAEVARILERPQRRMLSPFVLAELDYLMTRIAGQRAAMTVLDDVAHGAFELAPFGAEDVAEARGIMGRYADLELGLADASIVVLAGRHSCVDVLTLDERHFRALRTAAGDAFRLLPAGDL
jgi:predicted nucleic acid-binding protein